MVKSTIEKFSSTQAGPAILWVVGDLIRILIKKCFYELESLFLYNFCSKILGAINQYLTGLCQGSALVAGKLTRSERVETKHIVHIEFPPWIAS